MGDKDKNNKKKNKPVVPEYDSYALSGKNAPKDPNSGTTIPSVEQVIEAKKFVEENKK